MVVTSAGVHVLRPPSWQRRQVEAFRAEDFGLITVARESNNNLVTLATCNRDNFGRILNKKEEGGGKY